MLCLTIIMAEDEELYAFAYKVLTTVSCTIRKMGLRAHERIQRIGDMYRITQGQSACYSRAVYTVLFRPVCTNTRQPE